MPDTAPHTVYLKDYTPSAFLISDVDLDVEVFEDHTRDASRLTVRRNPASPAAGAPLALDGEELTLESVAVNGNRLSPADFAVTPERLTIRDVPEQFVLQTVVRIDPKANTTLSGF